MASVTETIQVSGIRCERCVNRLAGALTAKRKVPDGSKICRRAFPLSATTRRVSDTATPLGVLN